MKVLKRFLIVCLLFVFTLLPALADGNLEFIAASKEPLIMQDMKSEIIFEVITDVEFYDLKMPEKSEIEISIIDVQKQLRWHKDAFLLCKLKSIRETPVSEPMDVSDRNIYMVVRRYDPVDKKKAVFTGTEFAVATAASFFAPGTDILYYFTKGVIINKGRQNWFKAGVSNAYENSICWLWLKGKDIELEPEDLVKMEGVPEIEAISLQEKIDKRHQKELAKIDKRHQKELAKLERANKKKKMKEETVAAEKDGFAADKQEAAVADED